MLSNKEILGLVKRRHPEYETMLDHWNFLQATYSGGRGWFKDNVWRYHKEGDGEYKARVERAYRFNHSREVVNLVHKYIFKELIHRSEDAPAEIKAFWQCATRDHRSVDDFMRLVDVQSSIFGRIWVVTDTTNKGNVITKADEVKSDSRAYSYVVTPQQMLDVAYDDDGEMLWCLIAESGRDDSNPITSSGKTFLRYRLWTQTEWFLFKETSGARGGNVKVEMESAGVHDLGVVPVFSVDCFGTTLSKYTSSALIDDIAYLDRTCANYLSNLDVIIQDQTFSQLAIPVQGLLPGDDDHDKVLQLGTKRIFTFNGEGGAQPFFLSPDPKQAYVIVDAISKIINEIYHSVGVAGERTKQDNAAGIDNSSGVAKAFDFQRVNSLLINKASALQVAESKLARMVMLWNGQDVGSIHESDFAVYPESFDIRGLQEEFAIAEQLALVNAPDTLRREQMRILADKVLPSVNKTVAAEIEKELLKFPPKDDLGIDVKSAVTYNQGSAAQDTEQKPKKAEQDTASAKKE